MAELANTGVRIGPASWLGLAAAAAAGRDKLRAEPNAITESAAVHWGSPAQVKAAFAAVRVSIPDTRAETLAEVGRPLAARLAAFRGATKAANTYGVEWVRRHVTPDCQVYVGWHQRGGVTGRMSSSGPNLQQIPRGDEYPRCFTARPGHVLIGSGYSQVEL